MLNSTDVRVSNYIRSAVVQTHCNLQSNSTYPEAGFPDRLGRSSKFVENSTKQTCLEIADYRIKYSAVLWLIKLANQARSKGVDAGTYRK